MWEMGQKQNLQPGTTMHPMRMTKESKSAQRGAEGLLAMVI
jgi:hypothetical protein